MNVPRSIAERIQSELILMLDHVPTIDLASAYRMVKELTGVEDVQIAEGLSVLVRTRRIAIETRTTGPRGPLVGYIRRAEVD